MVRSLLAQSTTGKPKVLLLGISYPSVEVQMEKHGYEKDVLVHTEPSVDQAVECVKRGILTEMDARDLARCVATEQACEVDTYTVSKEIGAVYRNDRHAYGDFNGRNFCKSLRDAFGEDVQFSQVILDYYWMPSGWLVTRWAKTLFQQTLPDLVRLNMLTYPGARRRKRDDERAKYDEGVVYLPFCAHVCKELVGGIHLLEKYYAITFVSKSELAGHALWKGTMSIDGDTMQHVLGKRLDQEEVYCTFRPKDIYENMEDSHVRKPAVMRVLQAIEDYDNIRMIRLRPLRQHEPPSVLKERLTEPEKGGFIGLNFNLLRDKKRKAEMEAKRKKVTAQKEREKIRKVEEKERMAIKRQRKAERKKKVLQHREKKARKRAQQKGRELEQREQAVYEDVEEVRLEESQFKFFYPGPAADIETYEEPEANQGTAADENITWDERASWIRKKKPPASPAKRSKVVRSPQHFLAHNPRVGARKHHRVAIRRKTKNAGPGSAVLDVYIPPGEHEVEGACKLMGMRDRGFKDVSCNIYGRNELTCFKVPAEGFRGPSKLSTEEEIKIERWKVKVTRSIFGREEGNQRNFVLLDRYKNMDDILNWLRNHMHPMFDPSKKFGELHLEHEWFGNEGIFEVAVDLEEELHDQMISEMAELSTTNQEWDELFTSIYDWLRNDRMENDPMGEYSSMKLRLQTASFEGDEELANEMTFRILILRKFCGDWSPVGNQTGPPGNAVTVSPNILKELPREPMPLLENKDVMSPPRKEMPLPSVAQLSRPNTRSTTRSTPEINKGRKRRASPKKKAADVKIARTSPGSRMRTRSNAAHVEVEMASECGERFQTLSLKRNGRKGGMSPIVGCISGTTDSKPSQHAVPTQIPITTVQENDALDLLRIFNTTEAEAQRFFTEASDKIGLKRTRLLCRILRFLEDPYPEWDETGELRWIAKLMPPRMHLVRKAYIMEAVLNNLREGRGENWYGLSYIPGGLGVLLSEVLQDIEALERIPDEAFRLKELMGGQVYPQCVSPSPPASVADGY